MRKLGVAPYKIDGLRFQDELKKMMYGFGDSLEPNWETMELMEQYLIEFVANIVNCVFKRSQRGGNHNMQLGDLLHYLQQNMKVSTRVPFILEINSKIDKKKLNNI